MTEIETVRTQYAALIEREEETRAKLADTRVKLKNAREVDISAAAEAALAGRPAPKRTELTLRHAEENLGVELDGIDEAVYRLQLEARAAVGELHSSFPIFIPDGVPATRAEVVDEWIVGKRPGDGESDAEFRARIDSQIPRGHQDAESIVAEAHRQREVSMDRRLPRLTKRPDDLIAWVESAYDAEDGKAAASYEFQAKKQRGARAVAAVQRAKSEHQRLGHPAGSFNMRAYPDIVLPEHLAEFEEPIARSPFQQVRDRLPSMQERQNEPVAEAQPVNEDDALRKREIAGIPPAAAPDATTVSA